MSILANISQSLSALNATIASILKIILLSRPASVRRTAGKDDELVILGNGPSLNNTIADHGDFLGARRKLAVNFAANTPVFTQLKPDFYVLADPHFFHPDGDANVNRLWQALTAVDWRMTLYLPVKEAAPDGFSNPNVTIERYNLTPVEGFRCFSHTAYRRLWGMPRPRNVLIPSIMLSIAAGFRTIYVAGADHSWMQTISVDDRNRVVSVQPHFYKDNEREKARVSGEYSNYPLHQIVYSFYVAFRSYHTIQEYAVKRQVRIFNITPGSFIDAFPRKKLD